MIKINYIQKSYDYKDVGSQDYDIETNVVLNEDISASDAIRAFLRLLNIATYNVTPQTLKNLVEDLKDEGYADNDKIM